MKRPVITGATHGSSRLHLARPDRAAGDPPRHCRDLGGREWLPFRRHPLVGIGRGHAAKDFGFGRLARHDRRADVATREQSLTAVDPQS